jgi:hypothetical protein
MTCLQPPARSGRLVRLLLSAVALTALASCSSDEPAANSSATSPPASAASPASTASPAAAASRSATSSPTGSPADGTNYKACDRGDCEIAVSGPVTIALSRFGDVGPFTVRKVNADSVDVRMTLPAGPSLDVTIKQGCTTTFYGNNASGFAHTSCSGAEPEDILGMYVKQMVTVKSITGGTAILKLVSD